MIKQDYIHLAEVAMSLKPQFTGDVSGRGFDASGFDEFIRRMIWAIRASPDGSHDLDDNDFRDMALGKKNFE